MPGILAPRLTFQWGRDVPTLCIAAAHDVPIPLDRVTELYDCTQATKRMFILPRADHQHFVDDVEGAHEAVRAMSFPGDAAWIPKAMPPMAELMPGDRDAPSALCAALSQAPGSTSPTS
jgi:pimeloyl-ACP methyl ester carboxylesterase